MPYNNGRGFYGNQAIGNQTTLGQLASMNRADMGFEDFYKGRPELGAGNEFNYDWRTIARPNIKKGQGPLERPGVPSPMRLGGRLKAATTAGLTPAQYGRWSRQIGRNMTWGGYARDPHTGQAMQALNEAGEQQGVPGSSFAPEFAKRQTRSSRGRTTGLSEGTPGTLVGSPSPPGTVMGAPDPFGEAVTPMATSVSDEDSTRQSLYNFADDIEGRAPGAVGRGVAAGVRKIGSGNVSTIPGAIGAVVGSTARSVGAAAVGKVGEAVKSRWAGAKQPGTQFPEPPPDPFA